MSSTKVKTTLYWVGEIHWEDIDTDHAEIEVTVGVELWESKGSTDEFGRKMEPDCSGADIVGVDGLTINPLQQDRDISEDEFAEITGQTVEEWIDGEINIMERAGEEYEKASPRHW